MKALSIRQPYAWLVVNGYKDVENRTRPISYRGPILIHASLAPISRDEDEYIRACLREVGYEILPTREMERGGIVGSAEIIDCVEYDESPWFVGPYGYILANQSILEFRPAKGRLGLFEIPL